MAGVVLSCQGCGALIELERPDQPKPAACPVCNGKLASFEDLRDGPESSSDFVENPGVGSWFRQSKLLFVAIALLVAPGVAAFLVHRSADMRSRTSSASLTGSGSSIDLVERGSLSTKTASLDREVVPASGSTEPPPPPPAPVAASLDAVLDRSVDNSTRRLGAGAAPPAPAPVEPEAGESSAKIPDPPEEVKPETNDKTSKVPPKPEQVKSPKTGTSKPTHVPKPSDPIKLPPPPTAPRILVHDATGKVFVTKVHAQLGNRTAVFLPDGQIGWPDRHSFTESPFVPATADEIAKELSYGEFKGFHVLKTQHYVLVYDCSKNFAVASSKLLESLYNGLAKALVKSGIEVHEAEFPLVAVIYAQEKEFRARSKIAPQVQAYYDVLSNRIYFHEKSDHDQNNPEVAAMRKPQTVAHEGTHQVLHNLGVQPRLAPWPLWIVEGLAEYCAPMQIKKGATWAGVGKVNPLHMATIKDLEDQMTLQFVAKGENTNRIGRDPRISLCEYLATRKELTPTDYALSWALTHYLINRKQPEFIAYLKSLSKLSPLATRTPKENLDSFREAFGLDLAKLDRAVAKHLNQLPHEELPYFAVLFRQPINNRGLVRKSVLVSQSPLMIRQWVESMIQPTGGQPEWVPIPHPTRTRAQLTAREWMQEQ